MSSIHSYVFSGGVILMAAGIWSCSGQASQEHAKAPEVHTNVDTQMIKLYPGGATYRNDDKERKMVRLADGTEVLLGPNTEIRVSKEFNQAERGLVLNGEAFFNVSGNASKAFVIHTRNLQIHVLGTRFRVDAFAANAGEEVNLLEGKLK